LRQIAFMTPTCWVIAGPNGAGKTTFALEYLPLLSSCKRFINADLIAAGLSPLAPELQQLAASRIFLREMRTCIRNRENFAFETTLSGRAYLRIVQQLKSQGWQVDSSSRAASGIYCIMRSIRICSGRQDFEYGYHDFHPLRKEPGDPRRAQGGHRQDTR